MVVCLNSGPWWRVYQFKRTGAVKILYRFKDRWIFLDNLSPAERKEWKAFEKYLMRLDRRLRLKGVKEKFR